MVGAEVCSGEAVGAELERQFDNPLVSYIHLHNAKRGCFSCLVRRVSAGGGETLTPPSRRRPKARFARFGPRLMSNVRLHS